MKQQHVYWLAALLVILLLMFGISPEEKTTAVGYTAYNDTNIGIVAIAVNGQGGVLNAAAHEGGGEVCCVVIPKKWTPGLKAKIQWEEAGHFLTNDHGELVLRDNGSQILVEAPWREREVEIPRYGEELGTFQIFFLKNDEIKITSGFKVKSI